MHLWAGAALRRRSGSNLNHVLKAAIPETQMLDLFQGLDAIIGHSTEESGRSTIDEGMTAVSPERFSVCG
jgi:hypothetical protein